MPKLLIRTLGCKVNFSDSEGIAERFLKNGFSIAKKGETPDVCVVNTCTVTMKADAQCRNEIRRLKRLYPKAKVLVTGCYVNTSKGELEKIGGIEFLSHCHPEPERAERVEGEGSSLSGFFGRSLPQNDSRVRPQIKVQDGCDNFCTYCIVPYARGRSRSLPIKEAVERIVEVEKAGYKEAVLTGIHLGAYGKDLVPKSSLYELLKKVLGEIKEMRIRLSSIEPDELTDEMIELVTSSEKISPHLHIPLQSGDDQVLQWMGRRYTTAEYSRVIQILTEKRKDLAIGADVIVGFPGETNEHFLRTLDLVKRLDIAYLHVFPYSKRKLTKAAELKDTVSPKEKKRRAEELRKVSDEKRKAYFKRFLGQKVSVVVETRRDRKTGLLRGVTGNYIPVLFEGDDSLIGKRIDVVCKIIDGEIK